ncbi:PilT protein domain protein [Gloeomargarita lithophora Alchichica-D10]|uniref:PilT protein domain protein n=1 Tax=Gloeomargarita lithophora Alchichica-D10 TaxID=1188229 RepID=A0A1J0AG04_9CYAN|nr:PilT protein domain protein [Gloeomargarita lithophora Alchichica-D10]
MAVVADTHACVWYILQPERLSNAALKALEYTVNGGEIIYLYSISTVEICFLIERGRLPAIVLERLTKAINQPDSSVVIVPLDQAISLTVRQIDRATVPEMPDRIIAATALHLKIPLITRDHRIQALQNIQTLW